MCSKELGIFGLFSYKEFKYDNVFFGIEKNNIADKNQINIIGSYMFNKGHRLFRTLSSVSSDDFAEHYNGFLTFLSVNKFKESDFVSYILPKNIEKCYSKCFLRKKDQTHQKNIEVIYKHLSTLSIVGIDILDNNISLRLKSRVCDDEIVLYVRSQSNNIEILDDLIMFYQMPLDDKHYDQAELSYMIKNNMINTMYLYDTTKLFPKGNDEIIINELKKMISDEENLYLKNVEYKFNFFNPMTLITSKSFFICTDLVSWNVSYERRVKKYIILNINKVNSINLINKVSFPFLVSDKTEITDSEFLNKINKCVKKIHDIIYLLQYEF